MKKLISVVVATVVTSQLGTAHGQSGSVKTSDPKTPVTLKFFGTTGWEISDGSVVILVDPYLSRLRTARPGPLDPADHRPILGLDDVLKPDEQVIDAHVNWRSIGMTIGSRSRHLRRKGARASRTLVRRCTRRRRARGPLFQPISNRSPWARRNRLEGSGLRRESLEQEHGCRITQRVSQFEGRQKEIARHWSAVRSRSRPGRRLRVWRRGQVLA